MKIGSGFAAVEGPFFWGVDKNLQAIFDLAGGREINEAIGALVKTADDAGDDACRFSQAKIDTAIDLHVEIGIADNELKRGVVRAPREKFFRRRRALRIIQIERELPAFSKIVNRAGRAADWPEFLIFLAGRRKRGEIGIA